MFPSLALVNATAATMVGVDGFGIVRNATILCREGRIARVGERLSVPADHTIDCAGAVVTPGLIDCHTHVNHVGHAAVDFDKRLKGATRVEIYGAGGGVYRTMSATRAAGEDELIAATARRIGHMIANGVTTIESKSGAGLDLETELKQLRVNRALAGRLPVDIVSTFLGAHGVPPEYAGRADYYIDFLVAEVLPAAIEAGLVDQVDGFCDALGFTHAQIDRLFAASDLPKRLHADQYNDFDAGRVAARHGARSADHLEYANPFTVRAMADAGTAAVLIPAANLVLRETKRPPVELFREHGVPMAIVTNCNPGSAPNTAPLLMMHLACCLFGLTPEETLAGFTRVPADILGMSESHGTIEPGKAADLAIWRVTDPIELSYWMGANLCRAVVKRGEIVFDHGPDAPEPYPAFHARRTVEIAE